MINLKYACIKLGVIKKEKFIETNKETSSPFRFYIDENNKMHTENRQSLSNEAPHIYLNTNMQITLYVKNDKRYLLVAERNKIDASNLLECVETKYWNIIK